MRGDHRTKEAQRKRLLSCIRLIKQKRGNEWGRMVGSVPADILADNGWDPFDFYVRAKPSGPNSLGSFLG